MQAINGSKVQVELRQLRAQIHVHFAGGKEINVDGVGQAYEVEIISILYNFRNTYTF